MKLKFLLSGLVFAGSLTYAGDFKAGYVDVGKVFTTSKPAVALQANLKNRLAPQESELKKLNDVIVKEQAPLQEIMKKNSSIDKLSANDKASLEKFQKDRAAFQQKYTAFQQFSSELQQAASAALLGKANTILKDMSEKGNYDLVLISGTPNSNLAYIKPKYDMTDSFIEQINKIDPKDLIKQLDDMIKASKNSQPPAPKG
ncbi:MAG: hypothetical protein K0R49_1056 [Burkholderiales bacterium]|jgi:Skp family chaperone for outer membrane proteins|nr:hypothetical protein [Burkholderiales bacterium]